LHGEQDPRMEPAERARGEEQNGADESFIPEKTD
jgi:hypothetical protein